MFERLTPAQVIPTAFDGKSKGFGFVEFSDSQVNDQTSKDCAENAIAELNETE